MKYINLLFLMLVTLLVNSFSVFSQHKYTDTATLKTIAAGPEYKASGWHKWLWGKNYRNVWTTPVTVKVLDLDTAKGGLNPTKQGGGNQTKTLHLSNANGQEYSVRSVDKTLAKVLPKVLLGTFIEHKVNDEVSMSNPYGAAIVPYLALQANIYHTKPEYVYLPTQPALKNYNDTFGNKMYLFERHINGNLSDADNLGNFDSTFDTFEMLDALQSNNKYVVDQRAFIHARLFDMFINDWDRHEGQWRWGNKIEGDKIVFILIPEDRDQAFSKHDGLILNLAMSAGGLKYMQPFDDNLKNVKTFNYEERNLDRRLLNETILEEWQSAAKELQQSLTDQVIDNAVQEMPKGVYPLVANDIATKLKARRAHLVEWATDYYNFLAKEVQIPGSDKDDEFDISSTNPGETNVSVYNIKDDGNKADSAFYSRTFKTSETKEIRLFGLKGHNKYVFNQNADNDIKIKIIASSQTDSIISAPLNKTSNNVIVYGKDNVATSSPNEFRKRSDTTFKLYNYDYFKYDKNGFLPRVFYSYQDRLFVGLGYRLKHYSWGKQPFASDQLIDYHYSISDKSYSLNYSALFPNAIGHADFSMIASYNNIQQTHFFGLGNETQFSDAHTIKYYQFRSRRFTVEPGIVKNFGNSSFSIFGILKGYEILNDTSTFLSKEFQPAKSDYNWKTFAGAGLTYSVQYLNDPVVPTAGVYFSAAASGVTDIKNSSSYNFDYAGAARFYIPLISKFSLSIAAGAETVTGNPEFYQYAAIGGPTLRGVKRDRFWGKTAFYNTNDLRFISPVHTHIFNGKAGLLVFFDDGRVWMPGENSNTIHTAMGGGIILSPFNFFYVDATYGVSANKESSIQVRFVTYLKAKK